MFAEILLLKKGLGSKMRWVWVVGAGLEVPVLGWGLTCPPWAPSHTWNFNFGISPEQPWAEQREHPCPDLLKWFLFEPELIHQISSPGVSSLLNAQIILPISLSQELC